MAVGMVVVVVVSVELPSLGSEMMAFLLQMTGGWVASLLPVMAVGSMVAVAEAEEVLLTVVVAVAVDEISCSTVSTYLSSFHIYYQCYLPSEHLSHQFQLMNMIVSNIVVFK